MGHLQYLSINPHRKMWSCTASLVIILIAAAKQTDAKRGACRPVMLLHGLFESDKFMQPITDRIKKDYPGTDILNSNAYPQEKSLTPLWDQIDGQVGREFLEFNAKHPDGITLIGHSQGALLYRSLVEVFPNHTVHTLIGIAGPHRGGYGLATIYAPLLPLVQIPPALKLQTDIYYTSLSQRTLSFTNYWHDPDRHEDYLKKNKFLPIINNEVPTNRSQSYKAGFLKLKRHVTIAGPDDGVIIPWQSSEYSYYGNNYPAVVDYRDSDIYKKDLFGLRTLDESGRWTRYVKSGLNHFKFLDDDEVFEEAILPYMGCTK